MTSGVAFTLWPGTQTLSCPGGCPLSSLLVLLYGIRGGKAEEVGEGGVEGRWKEQVRGRTVWASQGEGWGRERTCSGHDSPSCCPRGWTWCRGAPPGVQPRPPAGATHNEHVATDRSIRSSVKAREPFWWHMKRQPATCRQKGLSIRSGT